MELNEIKAVVRDQKKEIEEKFAQERIIDREIGKLKDVLNQDVLVITGVRRCGKSILAHLWLKNKKYGYVNFDDERLFGIEAKDLNKILEAFYQLNGDVTDVVLDEPQNVAGWELFVNRLQRTKRVIVTGSNAKLLSMELATHLTGRHTDIVLYPFSFAEFLDYRAFKPDIYLTESAAKTKKLLEEYIEQGGFPEALKFGKRRLFWLYNDIISKDVVSRHNVRHIKALKELAKYFISNFSSEMTYNKLKNLLNVKSVHTVKNYTDFLEATYLVFQLERFSYKIKETMLAPRKIYVVDTGMINTLGFRFSENYGKLMENAVAIQLMRKKSTDPLLEVNYWKDYQQNEIDFVIKKGPNVKQLIQVCYNLGDCNTKKREINALLKGSGELKCKNLCVITNDLETEEKVEGKKIKFIPLWKWLLS